MAGTGRHAHQAERLLTIRLRYMINAHLEDQRITAPSDIARAVGLPAAGAVRLLNRRQWRDGDVAALHAVADRLGLDVPLEVFDLPVGRGRRHELAPDPRARGPRPGPADAPGTRGVYAAD